MSLLLNKFSSTIVQFILLNIRASSMLYSWSDTGGWSYFTNFFITHNLSYMTEKFPTLIRQSFFVQSLSALVHWNLLTFYFNSRFLTAILPYRLSSEFSLLCGCWHLFFFSTLIHLCRDVSAFSHVSWWLMKLSSALVAAFGLSARL